MALSKLSEKCKACPKVDSCNHKKMEICALAELPPNMRVVDVQIIYMNTVTSLLWEGIENQLSTF